jgi:hypothetical protein
MNDRQATALGSFCGLAQFLKDNPSLVYTSAVFINKRMIEILDEYKGIKHETDEPRGK